LARLEKEAAVAASGCICEDISLQSDGLALAGCVFRPAAGPAGAPAVIVCHGFGSCKENHAAFAEQAAEQGFVTLTFDFRGHGASEGCLDSRSVNDIGAALAYLRADTTVDPARIAVRGSSMGGYFALHAAARWPELAAVVAICPATETLLSEILRDLQDPATPLGQARRASTGVPRVMICDLGCWLDRAEVAAAVTRISPRPLLLIHCTGDEVIPAHVSTDLYARAGEPKTFWLLDGGDHRFAQHDPATTERTLAWLHDSRQ
jgi:fermentation-respiration switch protein FrsA (DUF1100 family)